MRAACGTMNRPARASTTLALGLFTAALAILGESRGGAQVPSVPATGPIPLDPGTQWVYAGQVRWTDSTKVRSRSIRWTTEVVAASTGPGARAAVIRGLPLDLTFYEPGQAPTYSVLLEVGDSLYRVPAAEVSEAMQLAEQLSRKPETRPESAELLLLQPLTVGRKWGQAAEDKERDEYCWVVVADSVQVLHVKGVSGGSRRHVFSITYRTLPDDQLVEIAPGVGITGFSYTHHGTVAATRLHLVEFHPHR